MSPSKLLVKLKEQMDFGKKPLICLAKKHQSLGFHVLGQPAAAGGNIETRQMSAVETGQMAAAETSQQKTPVLFQQKF